MRRSITGLFLEHITWCRGTLFEEERTLVEADPRSFNPGSPGQDKWTRFWQSRHINRGEASFWLGADVWIVTTLDRRVPSMRKS